MSLLVKSIIIIVANVIGYFKQRMIIVMWNINKFWYKKPKNMILDNPDWDKQSSTLQTWQSF
jgi:hypothetical protein